ncbi:MAG: hypothetical protein QGH74_00130 [Candidatus Brocadiia bacterium]|jgi:hypothetical protein|nr:hypothetical protein [Candidatus Brocadiia bacterium]
MIELRETVFGRCAPRRANASFARNPGGGVGKIVVVFVLELQ